jgi:hypothetical protein
MLFLKEGFVSPTEFDMDHFPPQNVGGTLKALVCKPYNSKTGHEYDYITKVFLNEIGFHKRIPFSIIETKLTIAGVVGRYSGTTGIDKDGEIEYSFKPNPKFKAPPLDQFLANSLHKPDCKAEVTIAHVDKEIVTKALLKSAYLACFHHWGYDFIFSDTGQYIRQTLKGTATYPFKNIPVFIFDDPEKLDQIPLGVCFIQEPIEWQVFMVNIPMQLKQNGYRCVASVLIPPPGGWAEMHKLNDVILDTSDQEIKIQRLYPGLLRRKFDAYSSDWQELAVSE